jgi:hypothetical protein
VRRGHATRPRNRGGLRIDTRCGLIEQQQQRLVQQTRSEGKALLPATRELSRELIGAIGQPSWPSEASTRDRNVVHPVHSRNEVQILADGEILPQRKALRHVADVAFDLPRFVQDVVAEASPFAARGTNNPHSIRIVVVLPLPLGPRSRRSRHGAPSAQDP